MATSTRLTRSGQDRMLGGVCGGLAEYVGIDPTLIRVGFVLFGLFGAGIVVYLILWLIVPRTDHEGALPAETLREGAHEMGDAVRSATDRVVSAVRGDGPSRPADGGR